MRRKESSLRVHPAGEAEKSDCESLAVETYGGRVRVEWDPDGAATPMGQLPFFIEFLKTAELFDPWVEDCPLRYRSPNAPLKRDVLGTILLSILAGHRRYSHITTIRADGVNPSLLGMERVLSEDAIRRAFQQVEPPEAALWQREHLRRCYEPLLSKPWILDVDTTIKPLYGRQEGAQLGYNPHKPGRPSHVYHTYFMANTRLVLDVEVQAGNQAASSYLRPGLFAFLDDLPKDMRPEFLRGDCGFGNEGTMSEAEKRAVPYLFRLRQTGKVKKWIERVFCSEEWTPAGQGWQGIEGRLRLSGWTRERRVILLRREILGELLLEEKRQEEVKQGFLAFVDVEDLARKYEYAVMVTSLEEEILTIAQHYRDRADIENAFDELKNQWGWCGYTTRDFHRCRVMARNTALIYNWWSLFVRLAIPERHVEAITSRPLLLEGIGRSIRHSNQTVVRITSIHGKAAKARNALQKVTRFLQSLKTNAEQLTRVQKWYLILNHVFRHILLAKPLKTPYLLPSPHP